MPVKAVWLVQILLGDKHMHKKTQVWKIKNSTVSMLGRACRIQNQIFTNKYVLRCTLPLGNIRPHWPGLTWLILQWAAHWGNSFLNQKVIYCFQMWLYTFRNLQPLIRWLYKVGSTSLLTLHCNSAVLAREAIPLIDCPSARSNTHVLQQAIWNAFSGPV